MIALMIALTIEIVVISDFLFGSVLVDSAFAAAIVVFVRRFMVLLAVGNPTTRSEI